MGPLRRKGFLAAVAMCALLSIYFGLVAARAITLIRVGEPIAVALGVGFLIMPVIGVWWLVEEWRLAATVEKMAAILERQDRLPVIDEEERLSHVSEETAARIYREAKAEVDERPEDWAAWYNLAFAYATGRDKKQARKALRHAADLYRAERRAQSAQS